VSARRAGFFQTFAARGRRAHRRRAQERKARRRKIQIGGEGGQQQIGVETGERETQGA